MANVFRTLLLCEILVYGFRGAGTRGLLVSFHKLVSDSGMFRYQLTNISSGPRRFLL